ncbi:helix-turn-helix domain-containing protein [Clostridium ljungdahlii]|uniref:Anaerobic benzoate catabolism transcriptional regulator n=1 Tax=Clostridium ljungdahlii TaxID=1538 RepID=A0A168LQH5_9CLOT|nr:helix-turn-helix transcriptional regulator [Clostridium ljungdahlii]OAA83557.1 anaerobic benzoate catabolism transcriptional regulator [Clostridium ljungdahlii]
MINYEIIGSRIRQKRLEKKLTQERLAECLSISGEYMSKIENGRVNVSLKRLAELSLILECPIEYLISGSVTQAPDYKANEFTKLLEGLSSKEKDVVLKITKLITSLKK